MQQLASFVPKCFKAEESFLCSASWQLAGTFVPCRSRSLPALLGAEPLLTGSIVPHSECAVPELAERCRFLAGADWLLSELLQTMI